MKVRMKVNGNQIERDVPPDRLLLDFIREDLGLTGTKEGCAEGECGACTVIMNGKSVLSCLIPAVKAEGAEILTVEGVAGDAELHPIQQAFLEEGAVQCGYCTPGMVLSAKALLDENPDPTVEEVKKGISGNLCRCTGYAKIIRAVQLASERIRKEKGLER
jgi:aerobic carbon-monoxide dehydrogenase small subunit